MVSNNTLGRGIGIAAGTCLGLPAVATAQPIHHVERVAMVGDVIDGEPVLGFWNVNVNNRGDVAFQTANRGPIALVRGDATRIVVPVGFPGFTGISLGEFSPTSEPYPALTDAGEVFIFGRTDHDDGSITFGTYAAGAGGGRLIAQWEAPEPWFGSGLDVARASARAASSGDGFAAWGNLSDYVPFEDGLLYGFLLTEHEGALTDVRPHSFWVDKPDSSVGPSAVLGMNGADHLLLSGNFYDTGIPGANGPFGSLWVLDDGVYHEVAIDGQDSGLDGLRFGDLPQGYGIGSQDTGFAKLSELGDVLFSSRMWDAQGLQSLPDDSDEAVFLWSEGVTTPLAREGQSVSLHHAGQNRLYESPSAGFDREGRVYVRGVVGPGDGTSEPSRLLASALWLGPVGEAREVVSGGGATPGIAGSSFGGPREFGVAEGLGRVVFDGYFYPDSGVFNDHGVGLWSVDDDPHSDRPPQLLLRTGQVFETRPGDDRVVSDLEVLGVTRGGGVTVRIEFTDEDPVTGALASGIFRFSLRAGSADFNADGVLDFGDIQAFIAAYLDGAAGADVNGDGVVDQGDIAEFVQAFLSSG